MTSNLFNVYFFIYLWISTTGNGNYNWSLFKMKSAKKNRHDIGELLTSSRSESHIECVSRNCFTNDLCKSAIFDPLDGVCHTFTSPKTNQSYTYQLMGNEKIWMKVLVQKPTCPNGWIMYRNFCFFFSQTRATWNRARTICEDLKAYLAEPDSPEIDTFLAGEILKSGDVFWLGGSDMEVEGKWKWVSRESRPLTYSNWRPGEPNNGLVREDCMLHSLESFGLWNDAPCYYNFTYICQMSVIWTN